MEGVVHCVKEEEEHVWTEPAITGNKKGTSGEDRGNREYTYQFMLKTYITKWFGNWCSLADRSTLKRAKKRHEKSPAWTGQLSSLG